MIGAPKTRSQKYWVGIVQWAPETLASEDNDDNNKNNSDSDYNDNTCLEW